MVMLNKLKCILLIDDDESDNFLHNLVIQKADCCEEVVAVQSARAALDFLAARGTEHLAKVDLIFLDINMPGMNGWEFLEVYQQLAYAQQARVIVVMLTTSLNPDDREKARCMGVLDDFANKPLTKEMLLEILGKYFPDTLVPEV